MSHIKRHAVPKKWPISRKGTKYLVKPASHEREGIPLLVILRDILGIAKTRKEVIKALYKKHILVNMRNPKEDKQGLTLFDKISIVPSKKSYQVILTSNGRFSVEEISNKEAKTKTSKINNKTSLRGKKIQLNLNDGRNILYDEKCKTNDSVILDLEKKAIVKILPLKEKVDAIVVAGKHAGKKGNIEKIDDVKKMVEMKIGDSTINVLIKQIMVNE